jgi:type IX secretion system PorP/SprF family membrane protein
MNFRYFFFVIAIFIISNFSVSANNSDTLKKDTLKTTIQDFSHSFFNSSTLNPAYTGISGVQNFILEAGIDKPLKTDDMLYCAQFYSIMFDLSIGRKRNFAIGINLDETKGGAFVNNSLGFSVSKNINIYENKATSGFHRLRIGITAEYRQFAFDVNRMTYGDMIDPRYGFIYYTMETKPSELSKGTVNFSTGIWYHNPYFYFGLSTLNVTQPNNAFFTVSKIPMEINVSSGGNVILSNDLSLHPSINSTIIKGYNGKFNSYSPAIMCSYLQKYDAGLSYMDLNKIGIHAGCVLAKHLTLLASCAFSTNTDLYQFGTLGYLGGKILYNFAK